ncbi:MAG: GNAT family N-acetyltransferase [Deltaproteobacteria bacterium]|nr:GNAT family N-acetyltransferase [Deltaproteobacteria bacterium]MCB9786483.1 GNAT family N-acetyltransferase [Deltaproteobacteria bacterium]
MIGPESSTTSASVITDRALLTALLIRDPVTCAYMLGDLDDAYSEFCTWYGVRGSDGLDGVLLVYDALSVPVLITYGQSSALEEIIRRYWQDLPGRALVHLQPHHVAAVDQVFGAEALVPMLRMGLEAREFHPATAEQLAVERLTHRHTGEIIDLYTHYPDNFFEPAQLDSGHYYGIRVDDRLVSVAGVHVLSHEASIATLGNIVTHPDFRGRGLSTACTSQLCTRLISEGIHTLALNVRRQNRSAVRVYEKLGFRYHATYLEGLVVRSGEAPGGAGRP